jgi:hypothetical protein
MKRIVWAFAAGYFVAYTLYAAMAKALTSGMLLGGRELSGIEILPAVMAAAVAMMLLLTAILGWNAHATAPLPPRGVVWSGIGTALIVVTTTVAYSFGGVSIVLTLLLLRAGVLILGAVVDKAAGREVRWFCWLALALSLASLATAFASHADYRLTLAAIVNLALYLTGYALRLPAMTKYAKVQDPVVTRRYFVDELRVAAAGIVAAPLLLACLGGTIGAAARRGLTTFWRSEALVPALAVGAVYAILYIFGTLIYLDRRENTFCVPLNRATSVLAGVAASAALSTIFGAEPIATSQLIAAAMLVMALLFLSPAHHLLEWVVATARSLFHTSPR